MKSSMLIAQPVAESKTLGEGSPRFISDLVGRLVAKDAARGMDEDCLLGAS